MAGPLNPTPQSIAMAAALHQATGENEYIPGWSGGLSGASSPAIPENPELPAVLS